ncbi:MAG: hypothetical protein F4Z82_11285 [Caldilineaceae bacterium SB0668_bin_21]|nr:hypothetical protein [Caldilineaceae bacterium SB0668_bin_21]MYC20420.1 hypothetical protein [Caldilineaceae bacterium SB0662_bin_25]
MPGYQLAKIASQFLTELSRRFAYSLHAVVDAFQQFQVLFGEFYDGQDESRDGECKAPQVLTNFWAPPADSQHITDPFG